MLALEFPTSWRSHQEAYSQVILGYLQFDLVNHGEVVTDAGNSCKMTHFAQKFGFCGFKPNLLSEYTLLCNNLSPAHPQNIVSVFKYDSAWVFDLLDFHGTHNSVLWQIINCRNCLFDPSWCATIFPCPVPTCRWMYHPASAIIWMFSVHVNVVVESCWFGPEKIIWGNFLSQKSGG